jgi:hypothetical protein
MDVHGFSISHPAIGIPPWETSISLEFKLISIYSTDLHEKHIQFQGDERPGSSGSGKLYTGRSSTMSAEWRGQRFHIFHDPMIYAKKSMLLYFKNSFITVKKFLPHESWAYPIYNWL